MLGTGCTPLMQANIDTWRAVFSGSPTTTITQAQVDAFPFAVRQLDTNTFGSAIVYLGRVNGKQNHWIVTSGQVLIEEDGLIRRTVGFPVSIEGVTFTGTNPFMQGLHKLTQPLQTQRLVDWMPDYRFGIRVDSEFSPQGITDLLILNKNYKVSWVKETFKASNTDFSGVNNYWISPETGLVLMSEQQLTPDLRVRLTTLTPSQPSRGKL